MLPKYGFPRLNFPKGKQREFIEKVYKKSKLGTDALAKRVGVSPRTVRDWKREKHHISEKAINIFSKTFNLPLPRNKEKFISDWRKMKLRISEAGGIAYFRKYGNPGTPEGRRKGGTVSLIMLRKKGLVPQRKQYPLPQKYSVELAEFIGIMLGDGGITKEQIAITLNSEADCEYIDVVKSLGKSLFGSEPKFRFRKNCKAIDLYYNGVQLVQYLVRLGLKIGNKVKQQVGVPPWILISRSYKIACLRGLMDTDGGVFDHKYKVGGKDYSYKKICFTNYSLPLLNFVYNTLEETAFSPKLIDKVENKKVWLYNSNEVEKYLELIGSSNQRLLKHKIG